MLWVIGGVLALLASVTLLAAVELRAWRLAPRSIVAPLFRWHDGLTALQSALLLPFALRLSLITSQRSSSGWLAAVVAGTSLLAIAILEALRFINVGPDTLYMLPQGVLGAWVIMISRRTAGTSPGVWRLGVPTGLGLLLIAGSLAAVLLYFGSDVFAGTIRNPDRYGQLINRAAHYTLRIGSYPGRLGLPIWVLVARELRDRSI